MEVVVLPLPGSGSNNKSLCGLSSSAAAATSYFRRRRIVAITNSTINGSHSSSSAEAEEDIHIEEIRVCTNRTCRRQGSFQTLDTLTALAPSNVAVKSSGCLGRCGAGPNLVALPAATLVAHCGTTARAVEVLVALVLLSRRRGGGVSNSDGANANKNIETIANKSLEALALRNKARNELLHNNNFSQAEFFLSQAIELKPIGGIHIMYKDRSLARLALGNYSGALEDAAQALALNPLYPEAYICQGDAFLALNQFESAHNSYMASLEIDPSLRRSKSFKARIANLEKLTTGNMS
ncbi:Hypothetical predicted protein [Prunus dulcis]|uniref:Uncharacterized protein n=1 Tax=Prunus dulcis TaxID=3755 RepID=A0A5E4EVW7_PRUDU|nr:uncharacterized protein LOC117627005 [Prunus dulcis]VVA19626.1 Hypothetical predicted protein [Prunus dulcis]